MEEIVGSRCRACRRDTVDMVTPGLGTPLEKSPGTLSGA